MDVPSFKNLPVSQVATKITTAEQTTTVKDAMLMLEADPNHIIAVVDQNKKLVGVISHADVLKAQAVSKLNSRLDQSGLVTKETVTTTMNETIDEAVNKMQKNNLNKLIAVDAQGKPLALVTKSSTLTAFNRLFKVKL